MKTEKRKVVTLNAKQQERYEFVKQAAKTDPHWKEFLKEIESDGELAESLDNLNMMTFDELKANVESFHNEHCRNYDERHEELASMLRWAISIAESSQKSHIETLEVLKRAGIRIDRFPEKNGTRIEVRRVA